MITTLVAPVIGSTVRYDLASGDSYIGEVVSVRGDLVTPTHTDRSVLCDMDSCTDCYHAGEGKTRHCGSCPCCKVCDAHGAAGCPICNG